MSIIELTPAQLRQAADLQEQIAKFKNQLEQLQGTQAAPVVSKPAKRKMSPAHIAKIRAAQKLRWAKVNAAKAKPVVAQLPKKRGGMSAEGKARIVAAQKARWAKIKAAKVIPAAKVAVKPVAVVAAKPVTKVAAKPIAKPEVKPAKKRTMSAAAKAKIAVAAKARWAKAKAAGKKTL